MPHHIRPPRTLWAARIPDATALVLDAAGSGTHIVQAGAFNQARPELLGRL
jgi:hypothetical protein